MAEYRDVESGSSYDLLISKLDKFIRKYYSNKILRGTLITIATCVAMFLIYAFLEHQFYLSQGGRKLLFFSYLIILLGSVGYLVINPLLRYFRLGSTISHEQAASILGEHFNDMQDKLVNVLQLKKDVGSDDSALVMASINQKADKIKLIPFRQAIDLGANKKYLKYALPPVLMLVFLLFAAPSLIKDSTYRIINNGQNFEREAPFKFAFANEDFEVVQFEDYRLHITVEGEQLPNEAFIKVDDYEYRLNKESANQYSYLFSNVRNDMDFQVYAGRYESDDQTLTVLPKPKMVDFSVALTYPRYTGRGSEILQNTGDFAVPEGTKAQWTFDTKSTNSVKLNFADEAPTAIQQNGSASFGFSKSIYNDASYQIALSNELVPQGDSLSFFINTIKDQYPQISVDIIKDSLQENLYFFVGNASDDYALTKLQFVYERVNGEGLVINKGVKDLTASVSPQIDYDYVMDIEEYELEPGDKLNYYFEVFDNDGVHGAKSSKTSVMAHQKKTLEELKLEESNNEKEIKDKLKESIEESKKIQEELQKLREKLLQKEQPDWQDKKELEKLLEKQKQLQENLKDVQQANDQNMKNQMEMQSTSPETLEKQQRIQELMEETVNNEMQELMEQIQELMQELNKEESLEMMEQFEMNEEQLEDQMERLEELYKQLEVEKEMNEAIDKLEELSKELDELSEETKEESKSKEELEKKQEEINKEFEELKEEMKETFEKNEELEQPEQMDDDMPEQMEEVSEDLEESEESLQQDQNQKASEAQKKASQKMQKMAGSMKGQMQAGQSQEMSEDIETIRQLLENLVTLSFDQESLVGSINRTQINTPRYVSLVQDQMKIKDDFQVVQDTLKSLAKRQPDIETYVLEKVTEVKHNLSGSLTQLEERKKPEANQSQRTTMKNLNDLALMLSESMEKMQQQMAGMMAGSQMCQNPGNKPGKKPGKKGDSNSPGDKISKGQDKMSEQLQKMMEQQKGKANGGKGNGAKDFAEAAAKQAALRKALQDLAKEQQEQGQGASDELQKIIDEMNKQEIDLVNKRLDNEMLSRQQEILTRLLEAESAQKERELDNKRKSESGDDAKRDIPPSIEEYIKKRKALLEQYKYASPQMKPHYKQLVDEYYKKLKRA